MKAAANYLAGISVNEKNEYVGVGQPGLAESFIPFWGSLRASFDDFQNGRYLWGSVNAGFFVLDFVGIGTLVKSAGKYGSAAVRNAPRAIPFVRNAIAQVPKTPLTRFFFGKNIKNRVTSTFNRIGGGGTTGPRPGWTSSNWFRYGADEGGVTLLEANGSIPFFRRYFAKIYRNRDLPGTPGFLDTAAHEGTHITIGRYFPQLIDAGRVPLVGGVFNFLNETLAYSVGRIASGRFHALPLAPYHAFRYGISHVNKAEVAFWSYIGVRYFMANREE